MKIEAHPALVNSSGYDVGSRLPSPFAFNHAIVKIVLDGKTIWVDPTESNQGGLLWNRYVSHFGKGLVIDLESARWRRFRFLGLTIRGSRSLRLLSFRITKARCR